MGRRVVTHTLGKGGIDMFDAFNFGGGHGPGSPLYTGVTKSIYYATGEPVGNPKEIYCLDDGIDEFIVDKDYMDYLKAEQKRLGIDVLKYNGMTRDTWNNKVYNYFLVS